MELKDKIKEMSKKEELEKKKNEEVCKEKSEHIENA